MGWVPDFNGPGYQKPLNRFDKGECTWYVYGRVYEMNDGLCLTIDSGAHGKYWMDKVHEGTKHEGSDAEITANSIAVFPGRTPEEQKHGHVVYIESEASLYVTFSHANYDGYTDGHKYSVTKEEFRTLFGELIGIIKL